MISCLKANSRLELAGGCQLKVVITFFCVYQLRTWTVIACYRVGPDRVFSVPL